MEKLFGVPIGQLMVYLVALFGLGVGVMGYQAMRNPVAFKLGVRNLPRRRAQTILVILGLMLATLLFSASFATGDTLTHSLRANSIRPLGQVDEVVNSEQPDVFGQFHYFDKSQFEAIRSALAHVDEVEGVAPMAQERAPVVAPASGLSEAQVQVLGLDADAMASFDPLVDAQGSRLPLVSLGQGEVYISAELADAVDVSVGDAINVFLGPLPTALTVKGVYAKGAHPASEMSAVMPLAQVQVATGNAGKINAVIINNIGDEIRGVEHTDAVAAALKPVLEDSGLKLVEVKRERLEQADQEGSSFATVFLLFGQFSIAAGILLIFLIFIMLAAERKRELGIARAVGMQRGHLIRMFAFEGALYSLIAAAIGSLLGIGVGWGMARIMAVAFQEFDFRLTYSFQWRSIVIAYTLGMVLTFAIVLLSSWRVSRLNIVRAVRNLPEPPMERRSWRGLALAVLVTVAGVFLLLIGLQREQGGPFSLGISLLIIGVPLIARRLGLKDRAAFTVAGLGLVGWWLLPPDLLDAVLPEFKQGIEMFFLSGIMIVLGAVWVVVYNADVLLWAIVALFGRIRGLPPVLRTAISYSMSSRSRTGMALAMISLVVFTLVVMAFIIHAIGVVLGNPARISGGFTLSASTSYANPIEGLRDALPRIEGLKADDFDAIGGLSAAQVKVKQASAEGEFKDLGIGGLDTGYTGAVSYKFAMAAREYATPKEVWEALQREPNTVVAPAWMVPARINYNVGGPELPFRFTGFFLEDKTLPEVYLTVQNPRTGAEHELRVIGVLERTAFLLGGLAASQDTLNRIAEQRLPSLTYMLHTHEGVDPQAAAKALEAGFRENGLQTTVIADEVRKQTGASLMLNNLLQGFMGLGLVVGIAALGVIAARSVVERRQQIGVLRALGFQRGMVQASFLIESSFLALLGIFLGTALGFGLTPQVIDSFRESFGGIRYQVPWGNIAIIWVVAYGASLLTTFLPVRQAAQVRPADALRYE